MFWHVRESLKLIEHSLGRSVSTCQRAFEHLLSHPSTGFPISFRPQANPEPKVISSKPKKRSYPGSDAMTVDRIIQPRISDFSSVNEPYSPQYLSAPGPGSMSEPQRKKRGRPSKAEHEIRRAEYAARGEPYPAPRKSKTPRQSTEGLAPTALMTMTPTTENTSEAGPVPTSTTTDASITGLISPAKQHSRPNTAEKPLDNPVPETPAGLADQAQPRHESSTQPLLERPAESTLPESQATPDLGPHGILMAQMREHAARAHPDSTESNMEPHQKPAQEQTITGDRAWEAYQPSTTT